MIWDTKNEVETLTTTCNPTLPLQQIRQVPVCPIHPVLNVSPLTCAFETAFTLQLNKQFECC